MNRGKMLNGIRANASAQSCCTPCHTAIRDMRWWINIVAVVRLGHLSMAESSFKRATKQSPFLHGAESSRTTTPDVNTSTGIPSLDDILGGGLPVSTSLLILSPDPHSAHAQLLAKYFIAQGIACGQNVCICDDRATELVESCMWMLREHGRPLAEAADDEDGNSMAADGGVKIAWRYRNMGKFQTTVAGVAGTQYVSSH